MPWRSGDCPWATTRDVGQLGLDWRVRLLTSGEGNSIKHAWPAVNQLRAIFVGSAAAFTRGRADLFAGGTPVFRGFCLQSVTYRSTQPVFMAASAATRLDTRIPVRDNHTFVSDGENHRHTQIEGCSALGSKGWRVWLGPCA